VGEIFFVSRNNGMARNRAHSIHRQGAAPIISAKQQGNEINQIQYDLAKAHHSVTM